METNTPVTDGIKIESCVEQIIDGSDYSENKDIYTGKTDSQKKKKYQHEFVKKGGMLLIRQDLDVEESRLNGFSNPVFNDGCDLNEEVRSYQQTYELLNEDNNFNSTKRNELSKKLNMSFRIIAGYYSRYEHKWHEKIGNSFKTMQEFNDFYYDLLRECLVKFDFDKFHNIKHENDYRKASKNKNYFNQYFYQALTLRKITHLKKAFNTSKNPHINCEECGEKITKITEFHLNHEYDHHRIKREFKLEYKVKKNKFGKKQYYDECPICNEKDVTVEHVKEHKYASSMTVNEYIQKYPKAKLSAFTISLQSPISNSAEGNLTLEDIYSSSTTISDKKLEENFIFEHIDKMLEKDKFMASVLKLKYMDLTNKEIALKIGKSEKIIVPRSSDVKVSNKNDLFNYMNSNNICPSFTKKYGSRFGIIKRERRENEDEFLISSVSESKISSSLVKLRKDKKLISKILC